MNNNQREIRRKLLIFQHAEKIGDVSKTCGYFGIGWASFYRWRHALRRSGEAGLANARSVPHSHPRKTPSEVVEKIIHLRCKYHLGLVRIMWYLERYHGIKVSDAHIYRILKRYGLNRLPGGTRVRRVHTKRYNKQVPGHHIQMDVKFLTFRDNQSQKVRRFQYTAIDDATRVRALKIYSRHTQVNAIDFVDHIIESSRSGSGKSGRTTGMNSRPSSTGMLKTREYATHISNQVHLSSMAKLSDHPDPTNRSFTSFSATKAT